MKQTPIEKQRKERKVHVQQEDAQKRLETDKRIGLRQNKMEELPHRKEEEKKKYEEEGEKKKKRFTDVPRSVQGLCCHVEHLFQVY